jgi:hypothetical protein
MSNYDPLWDGVVDSSKLGSIMSASNFVGTCAIPNPGLGDFYLDHNGIAWQFDGFAWTRNDHLMAGFAPLSVNGNMQPITLEDVYRNRFDQLKLIKRTLHLHQANVISIEKAFNLQLMILSEDPENNTFAQEIILKLEDSLINKDIACQ